MSYFAFCIFLSAFLLFQVEPLIGKFIVPWFGGSTAVWSTAMLFFQILLTAGYAYAAWLTKRGKRREKVHLILLGLSVVLMAGLGFVWKSPITPGNAWKPTGSAYPVWDIFKILVISVGLSYFLLSSNGPLIQEWFHHNFPEKTAYRLYSLSNIGSLLALVTYPVFVESNLTLPWQGWIWALLYASFAGLAGYGAFKVWKKKKLSDPGRVVTIIEDPGPRPRSIDYILWISLAATASALFLAVTSQITQEVASIPFLWVLPLIIYLFSFILAFSGERWYPRQFFILVFLASSLLGFWALDKWAILDIWPQIGIYSLVLFAACMVCHGELYLLRPHQNRLTLFYLLVSIGGAVGGVVINFLVPFLFKGYWELPLGLTFCWLLFLLVVLVTSNRKTKRWLLSLNVAILLIMVVISSYRSYEQIHGDRYTGFKIFRNFYGVVRIRENYYSAVIPIKLSSIGQTLNSFDKFSLIHGATTHGFQFHDENLRDLPTSYYGKTSGIGLAIMNSPKYGKGMRVGVLGLGIGTLATYGQRGDNYRFYEINPLIISLARGQGGYFSYLRDSQANIEIVPGDARISLEHELESGHPQNYDLLALDVFSSDSIPVHLIDEEAFALYLQQLNPEGILAVHISNNHLDLRPVVWTLADHFNLTRLVIQDPGDGVVTSGSTWMLLSCDPKILENPAIADYASFMENYNPQFRLWTDDYNNLFRIFH